jgi:hypothetical protein
VFTNATNSYGVRVAKLNAPPLWSIRFPSALPHLFSGLKVASTLAVISRVKAAMAGTWKTGFYYGSLKDGFTLPASILPGVASIIEAEQFKNAEDSPLYGPFKTFPDSIPAADQARGLAPRRARPGRPRAPRSRPRGSLVLVRHRARRGLARRLHDRLRRALGAVAGCRQIVIRVRAAGAIVVGAFLVRHGV